MSLQRLACSVCVALLGCLCATAWAAPARQDPMQLAREMGLNYSKPITVKFEWKPLGSPASELKVKQLLQDQGFSWTRAETTEGASSKTTVHISASRSGLWSESSLSHTVAGVAALTGGSDGTVSWSLTQSQ